MPNTAYLGFSAETGELSDNFDIMTVETRNMYQAADPKGRQGGDGESRHGGVVRPEKTGGSWTWFFFKVILFFGLVGGSYVGFTMYRANKRNSRF